jgi:hypothetical protein
VEVYTGPTSLVWPKYIPTHSDMAVELVAICSASLRFIWRRTHLRAVMNAIFYLLRTGLRHSREMTLFCSLSLTRAARLRRG